MSTGEYAMWQLTRQRREKSIDNRDTPYCKIARSPSINMYSNSKLTKQTNQIKKTLTENRIKSNGFQWCVVSDQNLCTFC